MSKPCVQPESANIRDFVLTLDPLPVLGHSSHSYSQVSTNHPLLVASILMVKCTFVIKSMEHIFMICVSIFLSFSCGCGPVALWL